MFWPRCKDSLFLPWQLHKTLLWAGNFVLARYATAARRPWLKSFLTTMRSFVTGKIDDEDEDDVRDAVKNVLADFAR